MKDIHKKIAQIKKFRDSAALGYSDIVVLDVRYYRRLKTYERQLRAERTLNERKRDVQ
jgi:hypothetical protein